MRLEFAMNQFEVVLLVRKNAAECWRVFGCCDVIDIVAANTSLRTKGFATRVVAFVSPLSI